VSAARVLARGAGFEARHYVCSAGPRDRPFEEAHASTCVALVLGGTFRYRSRGGAAALVPGAMLLGNPGQAYECSHEHGHGDRCLSFSLAPELLESVARELPGRTRLELGRLDLPAHPRSAALVARGRVAADAASAAHVSLEELAYDVAALVLALDADAAPASSTVTATDARRAALAACYLDMHAAEDVSLAALAAHVQVSAFHLLRTFRRVLGVTPHQYLIGARVARAAELLLGSERDVTEVAYAAGFGDLSHFIRSFRAAAGRSPGAFRRAHRRS
jgi:AraC family transcriptional regulator